MIQNIDKLNPMIVNSKVRHKKLPLDVITERDDITTEKRKRMDYYFSLWMNLQTWRTDRQKWVRYYNGDQWHEKVINDQGKSVTEAEYISSQGKIPLKQNLIKAIFNSILGQFRSDRGKPVIIARMKDKSKETEMITNALQAALEHNDIKEVDVSSLIEKGISGLCFQRITNGYWAEEKRYDILCENINPNFMFFNSDVMDVRWRDLRTIGRIIDTTFGKMLTAFGSTPKKVELVKKIYGDPDRYKQYGQTYGLDPDRIYSTDFYMPDEPSKCRVIEAWDLKTVVAIMYHDWADGTSGEFDGTMADVDALNENRKQKYISAGYPEEEIPIIEAFEEYKEKWHYGFYSPWGDILDEGETPYWHGSHPYVYPPYHFVDGKVTGLVYDLYDTQRQVNRLLAIQDFILGTSSKNTLVIDEASLNGQTPEEISESYVRVGGVLVLKLRDGAQAPFELGKHAANLGIADMIHMNMKILEDISGVHPSLQGQQAQAGTPASRVAMESQNSAMNLKQFIETFNSMRKDRNEKVAKTIQQFYTQPMWIATSGISYGSTAKLYEPDAVRDLEFSSVIGQSADSPVYRNIIDESLKEFLMNGLIDLPTYLENTSLPYADGLSESIKKAQSQAQTDPQGAMEGLQQSVPQGDPNAQALLAKAIGR